MTRSDKIQEINRVLNNLNENLLGEIHSLILSYNINKFYVDSKSDEFKLSILKFFKSGEGMLQTIKYIKTETGWGLKESKEYFDNEIKNDLNFELKYKLGKLLDNEN